MRRVAKFALLVVVAVSVSLLTAASAAAAPAFTVSVVDQAEPYRVGDKGSSFVATVRNTGTDPGAAPTTFRVVPPSGFTLRSLTTNAASGVTCDTGVGECVRTTNWSVNQAVNFTARFAIGDSAVPSSTFELSVAGDGVLTEVDHDVQVEPFRPFGVHGFEAGAFDDLGNDYTQAAGEPYEASTQFFFNRNTGTDGSNMPVEDVRRIITHLPPGFVGNPQAIEECTEAELNGLRCAPESQVGVAMVDIRGSEIGSPGRAGVYRMKPQPGHAAEFGFALAGVGTVILYASVRSDDDYGIDITASLSPSAPKVQAAAVTLWGHPADSSHDAERCGNPDFFCMPTPSTAPSMRFLSNPSECTGQSPVTVLNIDSWQNPGVFKRFEALAPPVTGCDKLTFEPEMEIAPTTFLPESPTGLDVDMRFPTEENSEGLAPPPLKKAVVTMPEGMTINPSAADGLVACRDDQLNVKSKAEMTCPDSAKIGTASATSPLLKETLTGGVYIRSQNSNDPESGEMFRIALVLENEERGLSFRLPGQIRVNSQTGRIEATFDNNPQLPAESIKLLFKDGARAPLALPAECGRHTIGMTLTSWGGQVVERESSFDVKCSGTTSGFNPSFEAGTASPIAGATSPFSLRTARADGEQEFKSLREIKLPEGLLADVSSVELCSAAAADAGSCGEDSRIGRLQVAAGAGASPLWVPQAGKSPTRVHLSGPYRGAPYSLSIVVPAQAGPFDLGSVVVRSALHVDQRTAQVTAGVDQSRLIDPDGTVSQVLEGDIPRILKGVVLNQREIRVVVDREDFMVNPTNCSQQRISAEIYGYGGGRADVSSRFRAADCALLGFKPRFRARILDKGRRSTLRSFHPRTRFTVVPRKGDANIGGARVALPSSTILDQSNIGTTCTRAQMAERACPARSLVGYAKAWSPLLRKAVEGPVYLAANGGVRPLPDLAAVLEGEIRVVLQGEISTLRSGGKARLQNTFRVVPDAPVTRFVLTMRGGKKAGLLVNSTDLCRTNERGVAVFRGQNGRQHRIRPRIVTTFKGCTKVRRQAARRKAARSAAVRSALRG